MKTEQRKHPRCIMKEQEVMIIHDGNVGYNLGQVNDLSMGGCSCKCLVTDNTSINTTKLSIFYSYRGKKFKLQNIPFDVVRNCHDIFTPFSCTITRRCGLKFGDISSSQQKQIELLISQCGEM